MPKKRTRFVCLTFAAVLLTGCGKQDIPEGAVSSTVPVQSAGSSENSVPAESAGETASSDGKFNETVYEQVCRDIRVADTVITVPGTLKDCGSHFSAEFVLLDEKNGLLTYKLLYDGTGIGYMIYDGDAELDQKALETASFYCIFFYNDEGLPEISVGGISISDPPDETLEVFGEPTERRLDDDGFGSMLYKIRDGYYLKVTQWDGDIYSIGVSAHPGS